jgi:hypothetical protein
VTDERIEEYWSWFAVALYLLVTVDLLTTFGAAVRYGVAAEANPLMRYLLPKGALVVGVVHLAVVVVAVLAFSGVTTAVERTADRHRGLLMRVVEVWLGLLVAVGLFVFANNLSVVVLGDSLV